MFPDKNHLPDSRYVLPRFALLRALVKPVNWGGLLSGYSGCGCGRTWWREKASSPGYAYTAGSGRSLCVDCYERNKHWLEEHNHRVTMRPFSDGYGICHEPDCPVHKEWPDFRWSAEKGHWEWQKQKLYGG